MDGFGDVLNKFERDADFELLGVDGVSGARVGDEFERDERRQLRQDVGRWRNTLVDDRVENRHQSINGEGFRAEKLSSRRSWTFVFQFLHLLDGFSEPAGVFAEESSIGGLRVVRSDVSRGQQEFREEGQLDVDARFGVSGFGVIVTRHRHARVGS